MASFTQGTAEEVKSGAAQFRPGAIVSNPATKGGYTWENAIIDNSPELKRIAQSSGVAEAKKALKKFRPDLYV